MNKLVRELEKKGEATPQKIKEIGARPLRIPTFKDRVVQEMLRMVLESVYEPEFRRYETNFGFRPERSCHTAMENIEKKAKAMDYAIEGDIEGAYDNVDHDRLIEIIEKKIKDNRLTGIIKQGLKSGIVFNKRFEDTKLGTTQGSILSPLLFNIYMHELDKYMVDVVRRRLEQQNSQENRKDRVVNRVYARVTSRKSKLGFHKIKETLRALVMEGKKDSLRFKNMRIRFEQIRDKYMKLDKAQRKMSSSDKSKQVKKMWYVRYADDFIIFTNYTSTESEELRNEVSEFLTDKLKLRLSKTKTKVTNIRKEPARFLGFQLRARKASTETIRTNATRRTGTSQEKKVAKALQAELWQRIMANFGVESTQETAPEYPTKKPPGHRQRIYNPNILIAWDRLRVLRRMEEKRFIRKVNDCTRWRGRCKSEWTTLEVHEIVERYNFVIRGVVNYYGAHTSLEIDIHQLYYLLTYSCYHTLASKLRMSIRQIIGKYTKELRIDRIEKVTKKGEVTEIKKTTSLISWKSIRKITLERRAARPALERKKINVRQWSSVRTNIENLFDYKVNWRTKHKLSSYCCICGSTRKVVMHHENRVRNIKAKGFLAVMASLNRKQIPVCESCHYNIHIGLYDSMKLSDLYDQEIVVV